MTLNTDYTIEPDGARHALLRWESANADDVSWVFVDGALAVGPVVPETAARTARVPFSPSECVAVDIHDLDADTMQSGSIRVAPRVRPTLCWNAVSDAAHYRVYHKQGAGGTESKIFDAPATSGLERYAIQCPIELDGVGGAWHYFRVEAVDESGNESECDAWVYWAVEPPAVPASVTVSGSGGTFDITLT